MKPFCDSYLAIFCCLFGILLSGIATSPRYSLISSSYLAPTSLLRLCRTRNVVFVKGMPVVSVVLCSVFVQQLRLCCALSCSQPVRGFDPTLKNTSQIHQCYSRRFLIHPLEKRSLIIVNCSNQSFAAFSIDYLAHQM